ncbi:MAG: alkaline phosphatase family protein, partial [Nitrospirota bacterium]
MAKATSQSPGNKPASSKKPQRKAAKRKKPQSRRRKPPFALAQKTLARGTTHDQDPIQHVIVLMLENRPFDQMLGVLKQTYPDLEGVDPSNPGTNTDLSGNIYRQQEMGTTRIAPDPPHETLNVLNQIRDGNFVAEYQRHHPETTPTQRASIMGYYPQNFLPALHQLAQEYTICDHWFSSVPGPTWTNRFFVHSGTSLGRVKMPTGVFDLNVHWYNQDTIFDRLNEKNLPWKVYYGDIPQSLVLVHQFTQPKNTVRYSGLNQFFNDAKKSASKFPAYAFIEPRYYWPEANDDHPPHDVLEGQKLIANVYNAIHANPDLWASSLLVILYDEHGGFYDHVLPPPSAVNPDNHKEEYSFEQLGLRVPALLVSPWTRRTVSHTQFDHTSLLQYLTEKWDLGPLGTRTAQAQSIGSLIHTADPMRTSTLDSISIVGSKRETLLKQPSSAPPLNENQQALIAFTQTLEERIEERAERKVTRAAKMMQNVPSQITGAKQRLKMF